MYWNRIHQNQSSGWGWVAFEINLVWHNLPFKHYPALTPNTIVMNLLLKFSLECGSLLLLDLLPRLENIMGFRNGHWTQFSRNLTLNKKQILSFGIRSTSLKTYLNLGFRSQVVKWFRLDSVWKNWVRNSQFLSKIAHSTSKPISLVLMPTFSLYSGSVYLEPWFWDFDYADTVLCPITNIVNFKKLRFWPRLPKLILVHLFWP